MDKESGIWSLELQGSKCAKHYLLRWAIVDVLSVLPFDLVWLAFSSLSYKVQLNIVRLPRCLKLLRLPRLFRCDTARQPAQNRAMACSDRLRHCQSAEQTCILALYKFGFIYHMQAANARTLGATTVQVHKEVARVDPGVVNHDAARHVRRCHAALCALRRLHARARRKGGRSAGRQLDGGLRCVARND